MHEKGLGIFLKNGSENLAENTDGFLTGTYYNNRQSKAQERSSNMKEYELIIERNQPTCGGKSPKDVRMMTVTTDDPAAYVRSQEPAGEIEASTNDAGELIFDLDSGAKRIRYIFTEA